MWIPLPDRDHDSDSSVEGNHQVRRIEERTDDETDVSGKQEEKELAAEERKAAARERRTPAKCWERVEKRQREENAQALSNTETADKAADWKSARASVAGGCRQTEGRPQTKGRQRLGLVPSILGHYMNVFF